MECACRITQSRANKQKLLHKSENDKYKYKKQMQIRMQMRTEDASNDD